MKRVLIAATLACSLLTGALFAFARTAPGESYAAYADAVQNATSCELSSCGCLGLRCSCFDCGK